MIYIYFIPLSSDTKPLRYGSRTFSIENLSLAITIEMKI